MFSLVMSLFLLNQQVEVSACDEQGLTVTLDQKEQSIAFFNLLFYPSQQTHACDFIMKGKKVQLVEEQKVEASYYIFVDNILLQEEAIEKNWARINSKNPEFLYANRMKHDQKIETIALPQKNQRGNKSWIILGGLLMTILLLGWILTKM